MQKKRSRKRNKNPSTGYIYDAAFLKHNLAGHPESPNRLKAVYSYLDQTALLDKLVEIEVHPAVPDELLAVHTTSYIERVRRACRTSAHLDPDTYTSLGSYDAAIRAAGGLADIILAVLENKIQNGIALVRPPGHHALRDRSMGFCLFNNAAVGLKSAQKKFKIRTAIVDFDVHHGNGTQAIFENDPGVLYISSHAYPFFPGTGAVEQTGRDSAKGSVINIPLPHGTGDDDIKNVYHHVVVPAVRRFKPDLIIAIAGYDGHWRDPLGVFDLSSACLAWISDLMVDTAKDLCAGKIVFSLNGGYDTKALVVDVANSVRALCGAQNTEDPFGASPRGVKKSQELDAYISKLKKLHRL